MEDLKVGTLVRAIHGESPGLPVPAGALGTIIASDGASIPYEVRFDSLGTYWLRRDQVEALDVPEADRGNRSQFQKGDRVRVKSREWYEANKDSEGIVRRPGEAAFVPGMMELCDRTFTIKSVNPIHSGSVYYELEGVSQWNFAGYMLEPAQERHTSYLTDGVIDRITRCFGRSEKTFGDMPLINENQLLTSIKLD